MNRNSEGGIPRKSYAYLFILPFLVSCLMVVMFVVDSQDKSTIPFTWRGRNGLTLFETLWDTDTFWGELWFNLLLISLFSALLLFKFHPGNVDVWRFDALQERKVLAISGIIAGGVVVAMALTWKPTFSIASNWFDTQFAYEIIAWPGIIGFAGLLIGTINARKKETKSNVLAWTCLGSFIAIWIYLGAITQYDPHAIFDFSMPVHVLILTMAFPCCLLAFTVEKMKARPEVIAKPPRNVVLPFFFMLAGSMALIIAMQFIASGTAPGLGHDMMFSIEIAWWWPLSHAWGWLFVGSATIFVLFASRGVYRRYHQRHRDVPALMILIRNRSNRKTAAILLATMVAAGTLPVLFIAQGQWSQRESPKLLVNQVGYLPNAPKRVIFQSSSENDPVPDNATFHVVDETTSFIANISYLVKNITNRYGHNYMVGDFSAVNASGRYFIEATVAGKTFKSPSFEIGSAVYDRAIELALRFFYYQRCNYRVNDVVPGYPGHEACHMNDAEVWDGTRWIYHDLSGGWHDAGDYNKYNSWFQTQWYCVQALAEAAILDPAGQYSSIPSLYDTILADPFDEALWGAKYLVNCINVEGLQGPSNQYLVWETVSGYRHDSDHEARMSYWGPPELDWTTPRRVLFNDQNSTFCGYHRGYDVAGTIMQVARLI
nr:glycoside hydrolase family 9 protein [Candidatus Sigynarchaeota archaeon]